MVSNKARIVNNTSFHWGYKQFREKAEAPTALRAFFEKIKTEYPYSSSRALSFFFFFKQKRWFLKPQNWVMKVKTKKWT